MSYWPDIRYFKNLSSNFEWHLGCRFDMILGNASITYSAICFYGTNEDEALAVFQRYVMYWHTNNLYLK